MTRTQYLTWITVRTVLEILRYSQRKIPTVDTGNYHLETKRSQRPHFLLRWIVSVHKNAIQTEQRVRVIPTGSRHNNFSVQADV